MIRRIAIIDSNYQVCVLLSRLSSVAVHIVADHVLLCRNLLRHNLSIRLPLSLHILDLTLIERDRPHGQSLLLLLSRQRSCHRLRRVKLRLRHDPVIRGLELLRLQLAMEQN